MSKSEHHTADNGATVEIGVFEHEGKEFRALGSVIDEQNGVLVGYVNKDNDTLTTWEGQPIATLARISTWRDPRSIISTTRSAYRCTYHGDNYHGQGSGPGMILRLHRSKGKGM